MNKLYVTIAAVLLSTSAHAVCTVKATDTFKNPNCLVLDDAGNVVGRPFYNYNAMENTAPIVGTDIVVASINRDGGDGNSASTGDRAATQSVTRNYAFGSQPGVGKRGTQSVPNGLREQSRKERYQALARRSTLTGPAVRTNPVTGEKTLVSVEITYSNARSGGERNGTHGPGQQR